MRRLFLILLIALLPLRGWAMDSMALQMVKHGAVAVSAHCAEMLASAESVAQSTSADTDQATTPGMTCSLCQLCHILGLAVDVAMPATPPLPHLTWAHAPPRFVSATLASSFKPPRV